jgi:uncharacterized membrane protein YjgN (DUF898 family)
MQKDLSSENKEITFTAMEANVYALVFLLPVMLILVVPYYFIWTEQFTKDQITKYVHIKEGWDLADWTVIISIILAGIVIHELLHGLGWSFYTKNGWKSIKFGIMWSFLTPYCHCSEPLLMRSYRIGSMLPAIALGIVPAIIAMAMGNLGLMVFGFFFTFAAGGDFLILWLLRKEKPNTLVKDHPDKIGCIIYREV